MFPDDIARRVRSLSERSHDAVSDDLGSCRCHPRVRALRRLAEIARRHYGSHADIADAIDRLDAVK